MMETTLESTPAGRLGPVEAGERIEALDVVRGFALIGILMMNVEFFNRALSDLGTGIAPTLHGADWWVSWFVQYFVIGKFWTIFSLLFGMGFAVMLTRAERAGRGFLVPYLRRIAALALFGAAHYILLWGGDILFSYAAGAAALLVVLYGRPRYIVAALVLLIGVGFIPGCDWAFWIANGLVGYGLLAWWLRGDKQVRVFGRDVVPFVPLLALFGTLCAAAGLALWVLRPVAVPAPVRYVTTALGIVMLTAAWLTARYHEPRAARPWRLGVGFYAFVFCTMSVVGAELYLVPPAKPGAAVLVAAQAELAKAPAKPAKAEAQKKPQGEFAQQVAQEVERMRSRKEHAEEIATETRVMSSGTYAEAVKLRAKKFGEHAAQQAGFAQILLAMFLLGYWFVRSGVMENPGAHLALFRKLAWFGVPFGVGLGLLGSAIATTHVPGEPGDGYQFAQGLLMLGNLPACLGYVSVVVLMLHSRSAFAGVRVLAPFGRMALSNYLMQSLLGTWFFYGYGLGHFGASRPAQMLFVAVVVVGQIALSHFWLARFRYGPMEWLWRAVTYWRIPALRSASAAPAMSLPYAG